MAQVIGKNSNPSKNRPIRNTALAPKSGSDSFSHSASKPSGPIRTTGGK